MGAAAAGPARAADDVAQAMSHLRRPHRRLVVLDDAVRAARAGIDADPLARSMYGRVKAEADKLLDAAVSQYVIGGAEHTLLDVSRTVEGSWPACTG